MGAAIGMALGLGLNALGGYAAAKAQQKKEHEAAWDNFMLSNLNKNPEFAQTPQGQKEIKRLYGEHADAAQAMLGLAAQGKKQFAQDLAGGGAQPQPQGGVVQAAAKPGQVDGAAGQDKVGAIQAQIDRMMQLRTKYADDPQKVAIIDEHLKELQAERGQVQHDQEFQESRADREQAHQDLETDRAATRQIQQSTQAELAAQRRQATADNDNLKQQMLDIKKTEDANARAAKIEQAARSIDAGRDKILEDFAKLPDAAKPNAKARVDGHNASALEFYKNHPGQGAPTLLKWTDGKKGGIGGYGAVAPSIEAVPPQYGTNKKTGKSGWMDADGNFYPDQD